MRLNPVVLAPGLSVSPSATAFIPSVVQRVSTSSPVVQPAIVRSSTGRGDGPREPVWR